MDALAKLFGSHTQVKLMRLFLFHPDEVYDLDTVVTRSRSKREMVRRELDQLVKADVLRKVTTHLPSKSKKTQNGKPAKKKVNGWRLNEEFPYLRSLQNMLINTKPLRNDELKKRFQRAGTIKLIIVAGIFIQDDDSRIDLLVVGDKLQEAKVRDVVKELEAEVGRELLYTSFKTDDFEYRMSVYDKLIRDVLDYPHEVVTDKLGVSETQ